MKPSLFLSVMLVGVAVSGQTEYGISRFVTIQGTRYENPVYELDWRTAQIGKVTGMMSGLLPTNVVLAADYIGSVQIGTNYYTVREIEQHMKFNATIHGIMAASWVPRVPASSIPQLLNQ